MKRPGEAIGCGDGVWRWCPHGNASMLAAMLIPHERN